MRRFMLYIGVLSLISAAFAIGSKVSSGADNDTGRRDYFTEALEAGDIMYFSPNGGENLIPGQDGLFRLDYWNIPEIVRPGQLVRCSLGYTGMAKNAERSIVYMTVLGDWVPDTPIAILVDGEKQGPPGSARQDFSFRAPAIPGRYRLRLAMAWAFEGVRSFWGDGPQGDAYDTGVCHYSEVIFEVERP